jgi:hypothetical protein
VGTNPGLLGDTMPTPERQVKVIKEAIFNFVESITDKEAVLRGLNEVQEFVQEKIEDIDDNDD